MPKLVFCIAFLATIRSDHMSRVEGVAKDKSKKTFGSGKDVLERLVGRSLFGVCPSVTLPGVPLITRIIDNDLITTAKLFQSNEIDHLK